MKHPPAVPLLILCLTLLAPMHVLAETPAAWSSEASAGLSAHSLEETARAHLDREIPDLEQAALWLHAAAEAGSGGAMAHLAYFYQQGYGVAQQGDRAVYWYERAVAAGELQHTLTLGWAYLRGEPVARDRERAEDWFRHGIEAGFHPARIALASVLIADALGGLSPERALEAEQLLIDALPREPVLASYFLARVYLEGIGHVAHDPARGLHFTRLGAEGGDVRLQGWLGRMYANGEGVEPDPAEAVKWANLSAAGGDPVGKRLWLQLEGDLSSEVVQEGRRRAVEWAMRNDG